MNSQTFNISLPKDLVKRADELAKKEYSNRSELIRQALRVYLANKYEWEELSDYGKRIGKKMNIKSEKDIDKIVYEYRHGKKAN